MHEIGWDPSFVPAIAIAAAAAAAAAATAAVLPHGRVVEFAGGAILTGARPQVEGAVLYARAHWQRSFTAQLWNQMQEIGWDSRTVPARNLAVQHVPRDKVVGRPAVVAVSAQAQLSAKELDAIQAQRLRAFASRAHGDDSAP